MLRKPRFQALCLLMVFSLLARHACADNSTASALQVVTEQLPPYNYQDADGTLDGLSTRQVRAILTQAGLSATFSLYPWARSLSLAQTRANTLIYSLVRTPERETHFQWIAPLAVAKRWIYRLHAATPSHPRTLAQIKATGAVCVVNRDVSQDDLHRAGFVNGRHIVTANSNADCLRLVESGAVPFLIAAPESLAWEQRLTPRPLPAFEALTPLPGSDHEQIYLAASPLTDAQTVAQLRLAYRTLLQSGAIERIRKGFLLRLNDAPTP